MTTIDLDQETSFARSGNELLEAAQNNPKLLNFRTLELNADYTPLWFSPLSTLVWTQVMFLLVKGWQTGIERLKVLVEYDDVYVNSASRKIKLPSVVAHTKMIPLPNRVPLTRYNVLMRDNFTCQYTGVRLPAERLNLDHVVPRARGGRTTWTNIVAADIDVNSMKGDKLPHEAGLKLIRKPGEPAVRKLRELGRKYPPKYLHETWKDFCYWDTPLDP